MRRMVDELWRWMRDPVARRAVLAVSLGVAAATPIATAASPSPDALLEPVGPSSSPSVTRAFQPSFEYTIPAAMEPSAIVDRTAAFGVAEGTAASAWGEVQDSAKETGARGVIVMDVTSAVTHPCQSAYRNRGPLADTAAGFLEDMRTKAGLALEGPTTTTFDGRPALEARSATSDCGSADLHLRADGIGIDSWFRLDVPSRLISTDIGSTTILIQAWAGTADGLEAWLPVANEFIDSIAFTDPIEP